VGRPSAQLVAPLPWPSDPSSMGERSPSADVAAEMLRWARDLAGGSVDEAADAAGVSADRWKSWESGTASPTMLQLRTLAEAVRQPLGTFFLPGPPAMPTPVVSLRKLAGAADGSANVMREARHALARREVALDLWSDASEARSDLLDLELNVTGDPEEAGDALRSTLGVSVDEQREHPAKALALWRDAVEHSWVMVFETRALEVEDARGFCLPERPLPVIVLNGKDAQSARCFTLLHECVHLVLGDTSVCDDSDTREEKFCDRVAAAALLPKTALRIDTRLRTGSSPWTDSELRQLASQYGVSEQALLLRLVSLGLARSQEYDSRRAGFRARRAKDNSGGPIPQHTLALKYGGRLYPRIVLDALARDDVTYTEVARHLDLGAKHIAKLELELQRPVR
jgi:Zn-dependent peptidase ImmA (M78 family)